MSVMLILRSISYSDIRPVTLVVPLSNSRLYYIVRILVLLHVCRMPLYQRFFLRGPLDLRVYWVRAEAFLVRTISKIVGLFVLQQIALCICIFLLFLWRGVVELN